MGRLFAIPFSRTNLVANIFLGVLYLLSNHHINQGVGTATPSICSFTVSNPDWSGSPWARTAHIPAYVHISHIYIYIYIHPLVIKRGQLKIPWKWKFPWENHLYLADVQLPLRLYTGGTGGCIYSIPHGWSHPNRESCFVVFAHQTMICVFLCQGVAMKISTINPDKS